jgi:sulfur carrier protein
MTTTQAPMVVFVNDAPRELPADATVTTLMDHLAMTTRKGIALAINDVVLPRLDWHHHSLHDQDRVLVLSASQGG